MKKWLVRLLVVGVLLAVSFFVLLVVFLDSVAAKTIERGGSYALGVDTTLDAVDLDLGLEVGAGLAGLNIKNPDGFQSTNFFRLDHGSLQFALMDAAGDVVTIPEIRLEGIELNLEREGGQTNYGVILNNLARFESGETAEAEAAEGGKQFVVERIVLADITATVDLIPVAGEASRITVEIDEVILEDIGSELSAADIFGLVIKTLLTAVMQNGGGLLPDDLLEDLGGKLGQLGDVAFALTGDVAGATTELLGEGAAKLGEGLGEVGEKAGEAIKGIGGLFGGDKKD